MKSAQTLDTRRHFLRNAGITLTLPALESLCGSQAIAAASTSNAKRFVAIGAYLGLHQEAVFPAKTGRDYETTTLLEPLARHREDYTIFSGLDHRAGNGHARWSNFLCGTRGGDPSLDQIIAEKIGNETRYRSLHLSAGSPGQPMNVSKHGVPLPMMQRPSVVFSKLFASAEEREREAYLMSSGRSLLDFVLDEAKSVKRRVSAADAAKLDEYFASVREVEKSIARRLELSDGPVATTDYELPGYDPIAPTLMLECEKIHYDLMALALETDASRVLNLFLDGLGQVFTIDGVTLQAGYHALSHHGNDPTKIRDLVKIEIEHMRLLAGFLDQLKTKTDASGQPLLDSTIVLFGTGMGDASRHENRNLPTLVAGGGFRHGQHIAVDPAAAGRDALYLGDLYLTLMQRLGMEAAGFSNATRNLNHLFS